MRQLLGSKQVATEGARNRRGKIWKLSKMDLKSFTCWDNYAQVRDEIFEATDTIPLGMWDLVLGTPSPVATTTTVLSWLEQ